jgi:hypothetical protein
MTTENGLAQTAALTLSIGVMVIAALVAFFDLAMNFRNRRDLMISVLVWEWSAGHPILPFLLGMLMGHLLWRNAP